MFIKQLCSTPCVMRSVSQLTVATVKRTSAPARTFCLLAYETNTRRHVAAATLLGRVTDQMLGVRFAKSEATQIPRDVKPAEGIPATPTSGGESAGTGIVVGDEDDTEGTERGRAPRSGKNNVAWSSSMAEDTGQTNVPGVDTNNMGPLRNGVNEFGNVYSKHEPTMFGDWCHMGRVTDF
ncbi:uncharacterized protein BXIN_0079 [Babesia sp. Xinjiang]|uniref:uncharacterized protein n=1 Tax=Babesia sp. Xinjiang TaxID=462227 RepID=UPI000A255875|nr:uncharacterized protein BXIN_0079 [Babesia sp. Xinjiang]ORM39696.1 hypothetical protein BXIN_0079 [Babesia sp. Xinjiang]